MTGRFVEPSDAELRNLHGQPASAAARAAAAVRAALRTEPSPGGGTMVRLQGAFRSYAHAHVDATGAVTTQCGPQAEAQ